MAFDQVELISGGQAGTVSQLTGNNNSMGLTCSYVDRAPHDLMWVLLSQGMPRSSPPERTEAELALDCHQQSQIPRTDFLNQR
jgi:hypothetical protein